MNKNQWRDSNQTQTSPYGYRNHRSNSHSDYCIAWNHEKIQGIKCRFKHLLHPLWSVVFPYSTHTFTILKVKVKWSRYRTGVVQRVGRVIVLFFHDSGTRRGWVVSSTPRPHFTPGKDPVPILQETILAPGPVWTGGKSRPYRDSIPERSARSQLLNRLSYPAHTFKICGSIFLSVVSISSIPCNPYHIFWVWQS